MAIKPREIARKGCSLRLTSGFDDWKDGSSILVNLLDYLNENHAELPTFIAKNHFIKEYAISGPLDIEQNLLKLQEVGYVVIEGNSITFTEKFVNSWQKTYELQKSINNFSSSWDCNC